MAPVTDILLYPGYVLVMYDISLWNIEELKYKVQYLSKCI